MTPFRDTADHSESIEQLRQQTQTTQTTGDSPVPVGSSLGVVMGVTATILSLRGLLVFLTNWSDYSAPWLTLLGWLLVGLTLLTATAAARANGTTLSTPGFVVTLTALAAAILIDVSSTGGFTTDQPDLTVIVGASAAMLPLAVFRSARQLIASMLVLTAVLFVILTLDGFTFEPQSHPQIEVVVAAIGPPLLGLLILNAFRRFVDQELSRNLNRTAKASVSKSKTEPTDSSSIDDLTRLDTEAEQLLSDVATGRLPLPLTSEQASAASALAKDLRRRLVAGRQQSWLQHAVHDSKALRPHVSVIDPANLAVLLDPGQREGLLSAIWLLAAPSGRSTPSIRLSIGPETQAIQIERDDKLSFSIDMSIDAVPRRRFDVTVMSSLGRVGSHVETGRRGSIRIQIDCLTDTPEP